MSIRLDRRFLAAAALGLGLAGSIFGNVAAIASPLNGGHPIKGGGSHGHGHSFPGWPGKGGHGHWGAGHWGVGHWGPGHWGRGPSYWGVVHGDRHDGCRLFERVNRRGEFVVRRVCPSYAWR